MKSIQDKLGYKNLASDVIDPKRPALLVARSSIASVGIVAMSLLFGAGCGGDDAPANQPAPHESSGGGGAMDDAGAGGGGGGGAGGANAGGAGGGGAPAADAGSPDGGPDAAPATNEKEMFDALGIDTTTSPRVYVDRHGTTRTLGDDYNPLGRGTRSLRPLSEIYYTGRLLPNTTNNQFLIDDLKNTPAKTALQLTDSAETWTANTVSHAVAADLDGDGVDEIVNVYWIEAAKELHANVMRCTSNCKGNGGGFAKANDGILGVQDSTKKPVNRHWFAHGIAAADVDGDGNQDLVVANFGGIDVCKVKADWTFACTSQGANSSQKMSVARGRLDDNPEKTNDDVVVAWSDGFLAYVSVYDGTPNAFADNAFTSATHDATPMSIKFIDQATVTNYVEAYVATGDVDMDGRDEIVLSAGVAGTNPMRHDLVLMDDVRVSYRFFHSFRAYLGDDGGAPYVYPIPGSSLVRFPNPNNFVFRPALQVFTKRSEPVFEKAIYAGVYIVDGLENLLPSSTTTLPQGKDITNGVTMTNMGYYETGGGGWTHAPSQVVAGDIDGSGQDSIVALWDQTLDTNHSGNAVPKWIATVKFDSGTGTWPRWTNLIETTDGLAPVTGMSQGDYDTEYGTGLALPNVDRDSPIVEYQGQHEMLFGTPRVLAVLAAAPYFEGKNWDNSLTWISFGKGTGFDSQSTIGVSASASIGYEAPNLFGTTKFAWKLTVGWGMDWISSSRVQLEETKTWTAGNEDAVVFQVIPFDVYYYKVLSSPDPADLDKPLSINVPRSLSTYKVPVALYNKSIVGGPKVESGLITHKVGDPASYPKTNPCAAAPPGGMFGTTAYLIDPNTWCYASASTSHVGVGSGSVGFEIKRTATSSQGTSNDVSVDFSVEGGAGGFTVGASAGFHWGYTYTMDTTESYSFAGQVGDLPDATHGYDFGLVVHRGQLGGLATNYPVFLVDYWVENVQ